MKYDGYLQSLNGQGAFEKVDIKVLRDALLLSATQRAMRAVLQVTMQRVNALPQMLPLSQEAVVNIAYTQGQIAGAFEFLQSLTALTEENENDDGKQ